VAYILSPGKATRYDVMCEIFYRTAL